MGRRRRRGSARRLDLRRLAHNAHGLKLGGESIRKTKGGNEGFIARPPDARWLSAPRPSLSGSAGGGRCAHIRAPNAGGARLSNAWLSMHGWIGIGFLRRFRCPRVPPDLSRVLGRERVEFRRFDLRTRFVRPAEWGDHYLPPRTRTGLRSPLCEWHQPGNRQLATTSGDSDCVIPPYTTEWSTRPSRTSERQPLAYERRAGDLTPTSAHTSANAQRHARAPLLRAPSRRASGTARMKATERWGRFLAFAPGPVGRRRRYHRKSPTAAFDRAGPQAARAVRSIAYSLRSPPSTCFDRIARAGIGRAGGNQRAPCGACILRSG